MQFRSFGVIHPSPVSTQVPQRNTVCDGPSYSNSIVLMAVRSPIRCRLTRCCLAGLCQPKREASAGLDNGRCTQYKYMYVYSVLLAPPRLRIRRRLATVQEVWHRKGRTPELLLQMETSRRL